MIIEKMLETIKSYLKYGNYNKNHFEEYYQNFQKIIEHKPKGQF